jgi:hypothetical protein
VPSRVENRDVSNAPHSHCFFLIGILSIHVFHRRCRRCVFEITN